MKNLLMLTIAALVMMISSAYAWDLSNNGNGTYNIKCGDGHQGTFTSFPREGAADKVCASHGGVISIDYKPGKAKQETKMDKKR